MAARFRCVDAAVIRVAVFGSEWDLPPWPDLTGDTPEHMPEWRSWLQRVWEQEALVEAIEVASPVLARRVGDVCGGQVLQPRRVRRVVESVVRYLLRMISRATPFGLFAGVAPLRIGSPASVRWGARHRAVARPDAGWLAEVITQLEARPEVLRRLPVVANNLGFVRGDRLVVPCQPHVGVPGEGRPADVSVRHIRAVQAVIQAAQSPTTIGDLIGKLAAELPGKPLAKIEAMLTELVCYRILVTSLHPPMDVTDPLGHVIDQLTAMETGAAPLLMVRELRAISGQLSRHLRLRIRLHDAGTYGAAAQRLGVWADRVRSLGLLRNIVLDTYYPEVGRYGTGAAMQAAEAVFAADSAVAIAQLTVTASGTPHPYAVIAASFIDLAAAFTGSLSSGLTWLTDHVNHHPAPALAREIHDQAMRLADPSGDWAALRALPGSEALALAWGRRRSALAAYRAHLSPADGPDPDPVLASVLHLHHARVVGIDQDSERICLRLARAAALGWVARNERSGPSPSTSAMLTPPLP